MSFLASGRRLYRLAESCILAIMSPTYDPDPRRLFGCLAIFSGSWLFHWILQCQDCLCRKHARTLLEFTMPTNICDASSITTLPYDIQPRPSFRSLNTNILLAPTGLSREQEDILCGTLLPRPQSTRYPHLSFDTTNLLSEIFPPSSVKIHDLRYGMRQNDYISKGIT